MCYYGSSGVTKRSFLSSGDEPKEEVPERRVLQSSYGGQCSRANVCRVTSLTALEMPRQLRTYFETMKIDADLSRDAHDWFNIVALLPVCTLDVLNWSCGAIEQTIGTQTVRTPWQLPSLWHGTYFYQFYWSTLAYFVVDFIWVAVFPKCVRSPGVILKHHIVAMLYMTIPYAHAEYQFLMGANMIVEVNTWFIIARRVYGREDSNPFSFNIRLFGSDLRVKVLSVFFYITWVLVRVCLYPMVLLIIGDLYIERSVQQASYFNIGLPALVMQFFFNALNLKWTYDLALSKMKGKGPSKGL